MSLARKLDELRAIGIEEVGDRAERAADALVEIDGGYVGEPGRQVREDLLKPQPLGQGRLHTLAFKGAGECLAQQTEPLDQSVRPIALGANGIEGQHAEDRATSL